MRSTSASGRGDGERDEREQPVVGQHHAGDDHHQRAVEQPRQPAPARRTAASVSTSLVTRATSAPLPLLVVVGEAQPVDVLEQPHPQVVERLFAAQAEPDDGRALADGGDDDDGERRSTPSIRRRSRRGRRRCSTMPRSIACWIRIGTTTRPPAPIIARAPMSAPGPGGGSAPPRRPRPIVGRRREAPDGLGDRRPYSCRHSTGRISKASTSSR